MMDGGLGDSCGDGKVMTNKSVNSMAMLPGLLLAAALMAPVGVQAGTTTHNWSWDLNDSTGSHNANEAGGPTLSVAGYANTDDISGEDPIETASLVYSGSNYGLHVDSNDDYGHGFSGQWQSFSSGGGEWDDMESVILGWGGTEVSLSSIEIGWYRNNYDFSLMAYTGTGAPSITGMTYSQIAASSSWSLVGHYDNPDDPGSHSAPGGTGIEVSLGTVAPASYYLLSVSNPLLGAGHGPNSDDGFKVLALAGSTTTMHNGGQVPIPATALLFALGLPLLRIWRNRS